MVGADVHRAPPDIGVVQIAPHEKHAATPGRTGEPPGVVRAYQDQRSALPAPRPRRRAEDHLGFSARRRAQPQQVVEQVAVLGDDQRPSAALRPTRVTAPRHTGRRAFRPRPPARPRLRPRRCSAWSPGQPSACRIIALRSLCPGFD